MIVELNTKLLELPEKINLNQLVFLSMVLNKNQSTYDQDVRKLVSLMRDDEISYLIEKGLVTSMERSKSILYEASQKLKTFMEPPRDQFDLFYEMYPIYVLRSDGSKAFLRTNKNKCRNLYNILTGGNNAMCEHINKCLQFEIDKKMKNGNMCYMKTMWRWLQDRQWEASDEEMNNTEQSIQHSYGTELF